MNKTKFLVMFKRYPDAVSLAQMAEMLSVSTKTASALIKRGDIPAVKVGREYRIAKVNIIDCLVYQNESKKKNKCVVNANSNPKGWIRDKECGNVWLGKPLVLKIL